MTYDSSEDTLKHADMVQLMTMAFVEKLTESVQRHDRSKLEDPEKKAFDVVTPRLADSTYGSDEYKAALREIKPALEHHYNNNRHHPEHFENGVDGMTLVDVVEMLTDWKAATLRHNDGNIQKSLELNRERFGLSDQLYSILKNTVDLLNW